MQIKNNPNKWEIFLTSVFFVLGFSVIFSLLGILLQGVLSGSSQQIQIWLSRIGGVFIIFFGLYLMKLIEPKFLQREYKLNIKKKFKYKYLTAFIFGATFAVGWTPCIGAILGAILTLAVTQPTTAFILLFSYSLGLGIPFLIVGFFAEKSQGVINRLGSIMNYLNILFGALLIVVGILVFTNQLSRVANLAFAASFLTSLDLTGLDVGTSLNIGIAFIAGLISFLSPCVLPLVPAFLTFLASEVTRGGNNSNGEI